MSEHNLRPVKNEFSSAEDTSVWLLTNTPSAYQVEFLEELHRTPGVELEVGFMRLVHRGNNPLGGRRVGFQYKALRAIGPRRWRDEFGLHRNAVGAAWRGNFDFYVLSGHYTSLTFLVCAAVLHLRRRHWAVWLERPWPESYRPEWTGKASARIPGAALLRRALLRWIAPRARVVFAIGSEASRVYAQLGASKERLRVLPYLCSVRRFSEVSAVERSAARESLKAHQEVVFLYSGQLVKRKAVDLLLEAFADVAAEQPNVMLVLLGDGPQRPTLEKQVPIHLRPRVRFLGHVDQVCLPSFFAAADVFVFPSRHDGWGVVINEACAAGLPIIATRQTGAAVDLVQEGKNGFLVERDDRATLARRMGKLAGDQALAKSMGARSREVARGLEPSSGCRCMVEAARTGRA